MENIFFPLHNQGMPGIITTLKSNNAICIISQQVNNFTLTLVTPLGANNNHTGHGTLLIKGNYK